MNALHSMAVEMMATELTGTLYFVNPFSTTINPFLLTHSVLLLTHSC